jgi:ABC-type Fe3+/spermidine/putrescine transport system ATPase subunit
VFAAQFLGTTNLIAGTLEARDGAAGQVAVTTALGRLIGIDPTQALPIGARVRASFRPEDLIASSPDRASAGAGDNRLDGVLEFAAFGGAATEAEVRCGGVKVQCLLGRELEPSAGCAVALRFPPEACLVLADE